MELVVNTKHGHEIVSHKKSSSFTIGNSCILYSTPSNSRESTTPEYCLGNSLTMSSIHSPQSPNPASESSNSQSLKPSISKSTSISKKINKTLSGAPFTSKFSIHEPPGIPNSYPSAFGAFSLNLPKPNQDGNSTPEKPYACNQCDQSFSRHHNLKSHYLTHTQERQYQCTICHHYFRRQHDLRRHIKLHTGERPHECEFCGRSFARLDALNRHRKAENGNSCSNALKNRGKAPVTSQESEQSNQVVGDLHHQDQRPIFDHVYPSISAPAPPISTPTEYIFYHHSPTECDSSTEFSTHTSSSKPYPKYSTSQGISSTSRISDSPPSIYTWPISSMKSQLQNEHLSDSMSHLINPTRGVMEERFRFHRELSLDSRRDSSVSSRSEEGARSCSDTSYLHSEEYLIERNEFLERRTKELEQEVISERKLKKHREFLEDRVRELEIEKSLLKSLLIERRDEQNPQPKLSSDKKRKST
ncbi:hypothetical protein K7432_002238 [Basidiobolus ranarum]|uniref:C2H2-type domain-containing protein n=1 Tax=Basidiobolus ranarum TaxID=34480 RepID=A0ABR2W865_9FUNG